MPHHARELWRLLEPIHAVTYFAPEPLSALKAAGCRGFWMGYFAGRAAPLGAASPQLVHALFYNFTLDRVSRALPAAWEYSSPTAALEARLAGSVSALRRCWADGVEESTVGRAADLVERVVAAQPIEGRALYAANRALPVPTEPVARLWHGATLIREHRGDGHVAALLSAGIGGRESHVWHASSTGIPRETYTVARDFSDEEWARCHASLADRGLVDAAGLTPEGARLKRRIEDRTDALASEGLDSLTVDDARELFELLRPLTRAVVAAGDLPLDSPMGLDLRELG